MPNVLSNHLFSYFTYFCTLGRMDSHSNEYAFFRMYPFVSFLVWFVSTVLSAGSWLNKVKVLLHCALIIFHPFPVASCTVDYKVQHSMISKCTPIGY